MITWFLMIGALGAYNIYSLPEESKIVARAFNPKEVFDYFAVSQYRGLKAWRYTHAPTHCGHSME
jgi:hypothetical protein